MDQTHCNTKQHGYVRDIKKIIHRKDGYKWAAKIDFLP
jgi:hypothetical protein